MKLSQTFKMIRKQHKIKSIHNTFKNLNIKYWCSKGEMLYQEDWKVREVVVCLS